jgi:hypothetical protein
VSAKSSGPSEPSASFRPTVELVLLAIGVVATLLPLGVTGGAFLDVSGESKASGVNVWVHVGVDLRGLLLRDAGWTLTTASLVLLPLWYWFWRRSAMRWARGIGVVWAAGAALGVCGNAFWCFDANTVRIDLPTGLLWIHVMAGACFAVAFVIAPVPRDPDAIDGPTAELDDRRHEQSV